jgi:hypothetical protein
MFLIKFISEIKTSSISSLEQVSAGHYSMLGTPLAWQDNPGWWELKSPGILRGPESVMTLGMVLDVVRIHWDQNRYPGALVTNVVVVIYSWIAGI